MTRTEERLLTARRLSERLTLEYAGAVPPGRVLACVMRAHRLMAATGMSPEAHARTLEAVVRSRLSLDVARPAPALG